MDFLLAKAKVAMTSCYDGCILGPGAPRLGVGLASHKRSDLECPVSWGLSEKEVREVDDA